MFLLIVLFIVTLLAFFVNRTFIHSGVFAFLMVILNFIIGYYIGKSYTRKNEEEKWKT